jgi:hypothetical protein
MMVLGEYVTTVSITDEFLAALSGCQREGPAEKAGREVDKAVEKVGQQIERPVTPI